MDFAMFAALERMVTCACRPASCYNSAESNLESE